MSEKIYALLLRLYPARFRQRYQAEALQLLTDRLRDEPGFLRRLRLWTDLLLDLVFGLPSAYRNTYSAAALAPQPESAHGIPGFRMLEQEPLQPGALLMGSVGTIVVLASLIFMVNHLGEYHPSSDQNGQLSSIERVMQRLNQPLIPQKTVSSDSAPSPTKARSAGMSPAARNAAKPPQTSTETAQPSSSIANRVINQNPPSQPALKKKFAQTSARQGQRPIPTIGHVIANTAKQETSASNGPVRPLAREAGKDSTNAGGAQRYSSNSTRSDKPRVFAMVPVTRRGITASHDCMVNQPGTLPGNVGYVKLSDLADIPDCRTVADRVMGQLNTTDAVILDLRDYTRGDPRMIRLITSQLVDKRVFVLTSSRTFSGGEQLSDSLKQLRRVTIIGEKSGRNVGITPDIHAADPLAAAEKLARAAPHRN